MQAAIPSVHYDFTDSSFSTPAIHPDELPPAPGGTPTDPLPCPVDEADRKPMGVYSGRELPRLYARGILSTDSETSPNVLFAPASWFDDGQRYIIDLDDLGDGPSLLIRDDLDWAGARAAAAEAVGWYFVGDFGDHWPELPTIRAYCCEGIEPENPDRPLIVVPARLWPGCPYNLDPAAADACTPELQKEYELWEDGIEKRLGYPVLLKPVAADPLAGQQDVEAPLPTVEELLGKFAEIDSLIGVLDLAVKVLGHSYSDSERDGVYVAESAIKDLLAHVARS